MPSSCRFRSLLRGRSRPVFATLRARLAAAALVAAASSLAAAGLAGGAAAAVPAAAAQQQGGTLTVLAAGDVDTIDPGATYYTFGAMVANATQRPLYGSPPTAGTTVVPDLADGPPQISADGMTVTAHLRRGVRFSPPVNREVTARDVKYAIERGFFRTVQTPYAGLYFGDIVGARAGAAPGTTISGIETPDDQTLVLHLARPRGALVAAALVMSLTAPVPPEYAASFDRANPSSYGRHQVATGPYMIRADAAGTVVGWHPGRRIDLVRNPNWDAATDFRPARLDAIRILEGNADTTKASRRILQGRGMVSGDFFPPPSVLRSDRPRHRDQFVFTSAGGVNFAPLNTSLAPFDDLNVRRAVVAGFDRAAALAAVGGTVAGTLATHFIPPGVPGFQEAGGSGRPTSRLYRHSHGDLRLARSYLRHAGFRSGRYEGRQPLRVVISNDTVGRHLGAVAAASLRRLGFRVALDAVPFDRMLSRCGRPRSRIHMCPNFGWYRDFADAQTIIDPLFNGASILNNGNNNVSQLDVPAINQAIEAAKGIVDPQQRAQAWGALDRRITDLAPAVALAYPKAAAIRSGNVAGQVNTLLGGAWDLGFTALR